MAGPLRHSEGILTAEIDLAQVHAARRLFDPAGHYHRPDVFHLTVDTRPRRAVTLVTGDAASDGSPPPSTRPTRHGHRYEKTARPTRSEVPVGFGRLHAG